MTLKSTYAIEKGPKSPEIEDYAASCEQEWNKLIDSSPAEKKVQAFLERNPALVPGAWTPGSISGHYPLYCALISQPPLQGFPSRIPDFMWISTHSSEWFPTLIEIERPDKKIFKASGVPTKEFTEARNQLAQWRTWFSNPNNVQKFTDAYEIPFDFKKYRQMKLHLILIYGRRSEFKNKPELSLQRSSLLAAHDEELISFDRLSFDIHLGNAITVKLNKNGRFRAIAVPPTFELGPNLARRLQYIDDIETALEKVDMIPKERKDFLIKRLPYWQKWSEKEDKGVIRTGDRE